MKTLLVAVKIVLIIMITVSIGSVLGAIGYVASIKNNPPIAVQPTIIPTITPILTTIATVTSTPIPVVTPNIDTSDWKIYKNEKYGFEIKYPPSLKPTAEFDAHYHIGSGWDAAADFNSSNGVPVINIPLYKSPKNESDSSYFVSEVRIGVSSDPDDVSNCIEKSFKYAPFVSSLGAEIINGIKFNIYEIESVGMMQYMSGKSYRTIYKDKCFAVEQIETGGTNQGEDYPTITPDSSFKQIDASNIIRTFRFLE